MKKRLKIADFYRNGNDAVVEFNNGTSMAVVVGFQDFYDVKVDTTGRKLMVHWVTGQTSHYDIWDECLNPPGPPTAPKAGPRVVEF